MTSKNKVLLAIPCFNCENQISRVLKKIDQNVLDFISEIIVVDNRSTDNTIKNSLNFSHHFKKKNKSFRIFLNNKNYSLGGSHKVIFDYALKNNFSHTIILHGDDQADIRNFLKIFRNNLLNKYDCVLGSRFMKKSKLKGYSSFRIFGNLFFNLLFSIRLKKKITDMGSGLNLYSNQLLSKANYHNCPDDLTFHCLFLMHIYRAKFNVLYYPISWVEYDQVSNARFLKQSLIILGMLLNIKAGSNIYKGAKYKYAQII
jgi:glycosyltransferase involved in cell wall biosynthesis